MANVKKPLRVCDASSIWSLKDERKDLDCCCVLAVRDLLCVCLCAHNKDVGVPCAVITFLSFLSPYLNGSYFPDGTLGNDNLWAIQSNYISCVGTQKKSSIINNEKRLGGTFI